MILPSVFNFQWHLSLAFFPYPNLLRLLLSVQLAQLLTAASALLSAIPLHLCLHRHGGESIVF
jgi:hypothetical protein